MVSAGERERKSFVSLFPYLNVESGILDLMFLCVYSKLLAKEHLSNCSFWLEEGRAGVCIASTPHVGAMGGVV
jgi:hypothetical protein